MSFNKLVVALLFFGVLASKGFAQQTKIGYANIELILLYMPEAKSMNQSLQIFESQLGKKLEEKQAYGEGKLREYQNLMQQTPPPPQQQVQALEQELRKLEEEIQKEAQDAEQRLMERRQSLLEPITTKLSNEIKGLAAAEGYKLILNTVDGSGVSIVLYGPPEHDLTQKIMTRMGIPIPSGGN